MFCVERKCGEPPEALEKPLRDIDYSEIPDDLGLRFALVFLGLGGSVERLPSE
jgi:hypothetical protein